MTLSQFFQFKLHLFPGPRTDREPLWSCKPHFKTHSPQWLSGTLQPRMLLIPNDVVSKTKLCNKSNLGSVRVKNLQF